MSEKSRGRFFGDFMMTFRTSSIFISDQTLQREGKNAKKYDRKIKKWDEKIKKSLEKIKK